ncbi:FAD-binding protein [Candidatus Kaiserbacteria bacterium]|nr:FAD-binding protein [Candidatus Kaiserbacteria bacterium]
MAKSSLVTKTTVKKITPKKTASQNRFPKKPTKGKAVKRATVTKQAVKKTSPKAKKVTKTSSNAKPITKKEVMNIPRSPLGHLLIEKTLREGGFRGGISTDKNVLKKYSTDESIFSIKPQVVIQPKDQKDVERAVSLLALETKRFPSLSLTPRAAGTGLGGGSLTDSVMIDVSTHMHRIEEPITKKGAVTITVEPGAMWRDVEKILKTKNVYLPSYPASKDICSIGGSIANNAAGPDSLHFGHTANWVKSLNVTLYDGQTYTIAPLTYKEFKARSRKDDAYGQILKSVFELLEKNEKTIKQAKPKTAKNTAGYSLWDVLDVPVTEFKRGHGVIDLTKLISGSQGTIGIITSITLRTEPINNHTKLLVVPVFDLADAGKVIQKSLEFSPVNVELFDGFTFDLALKNPEFFRNRLGKMEYYRVMLSMYSTYHIKYKRRLPEFILLITIDPKNLDNQNIRTVVESLRQNHGKKARLVESATEKEMFWQIRRASYTLSKLQDTKKRPAAFLEDITVPPEQLPKFFVEIKKLLKKFNVTAAVHGHGGNGHLHFYPLIDFTNQTTPALITKMADEFFATAVKLKGNICGEHNDGIIRTPHLSKMFSKNIIELFEQIENIFDPDDIFNPGKKVHPRFDIKDNIRHTN